MLGKRVWGAFSELVWDSPRYRMPVGPRKRVGLLGNSLVTVNGVIAWWRTIAGGEV